MLSRWDELVSSCLFFESREFLPQSSRKWTQRQIEERLRQRVRRAQSGEFDPVDIPLYGWHRRYRPDRSWMVPLRPFWGTWEMWRAVRERMSPRGAKLLDVIIKELAGRT